MVCVEEGVDKVVPVMSIEFGPIECGHVVLLCYVYISLRLIDLVIKL